MKHNGIEEKANETAARKLICEMIEASMALSVQKGPHPMTEGCNCTVCVNKREMILRGPRRDWKYRL